MQYCTDCAVRLRYATSFLGSKWVLPGKSIPNRKWVTAGVTPAVRHAPLSEGVESHRFFFQAKVDADGVEIATAWTPPIDGELLTSFFCDFEQN